MIVERFTARGLQIRDTADCKSALRGQCVVALDIASGPFAFYGIHMKHTVEPDEFEIIAGNSSRDADSQKAILTVTK